MRSAEEKLALDGYMKPALDMMPHLLTMLEVPADSSVEAISPSPFQDEVESALEVGMKPSSSEIPPSTLSEISPQIEWDLDSWPEHVRRFRSNFAMFPEKLNALVETVEKEGTFTVFFSSSVEECAAEKDYFMKRHFPALEKLFTAHGVTLRVTEKSWGMTDGIGKDDLSIAECMQKIDKSNVVLECLGAR